MPPKRQPGKGRNIGGLRNQNQKKQETQTQTPETESQTPLDPPSEEMLPIAGAGSLGPEQSGQSDTGESGGECWVSDEDFNKLAAVFAWDEVEPTIEDGEEVDDFTWDDDDATLNNQELEQNLYRYAAAIDSDLDSDAEWMPPELLRRAKRRRREQKGMLKSRIWVHSNPRKFRPCLRVWKRTRACKQICPHPPGFQVEEQAQKSEDT
jgi:hypothetical protein